MRRRVGCQNLHRISAIWKQRCIEGIELLLQAVLEQDPASLAIASVIKRIDQLVIIVVVNSPFDADGLAVVSGICLRVESLSRLKVRRTGLRLISSCRR